MLTAAVNSTSHRRANRDLSAFAKQRLMMKSFRLLPASEGPRREFKITLGLRAGYGSAGRIYDLAEAVRTAHHWMRDRAARAEPFLSGMFTRGEVVSADSGGDASSPRAPVATFAGGAL